MLCCLFTTVQIKLLVIIPSAVTLCSKKQYIFFKKNYFT